AMERDLEDKIKQKLGGRGEVLLFDLVTPCAGEPETYEKRIGKDLQQARFTNPTLIVADQDLSSSKRYPGLSESAIKRVADSLGIPECAYSRGDRAEDFLRQAEQREARIVLCITGNDRFEEQVVSLADGFEEIAGKLHDTGESVGKRSPGKLLASIIGKPEYADKISLYASGDQNRLASYLRLDKEDKAEKQKSLTCLLGYWLWDSVLRYPGVLVNEIAASSYLNIKLDAFASATVKDIFSETRYQGPFANAIGPMWWRGMLDDIVSDSGFADGRELAEQRLHTPIPRSACCEDPTKPAGYYCMLSSRPVSLENSKSGLTWFPRGADLARVSLSKYDELGPWL
ncbi:MAG TPA: hypothetical protein VFQ26_08530, partial [Nitrospiraceae bacterium]|nr:hypothetical protein [Nitrospiraceae bacterium]